MPNKCDICFILPSDARSEGRVGFFADMSIQLENRGITSCLITSMKKQDKILSSRGVSNYINANLLADELTISTPIIKKAEALEQRYNINLRKLILPWMVQNEVRIINSSATEKKYLKILVKYFIVMDKIFEQINPESLFIDIGPHLLFRTSFHVARSKNIKTFVIGASPFNDRGALFYTDDMLACDTILSMPQNVTQEQKQKLEARVKIIKSRGELPINLAQSSLSGGLFINYFKYLMYNPSPNRRRTLGRALRKLLRRYLSKLLYQKPDFDERYLFFPLHNWASTAMTLRGEPFISQEFLVEVASRHLPCGYALYVKGHPYKIGDYPIGMFRRISRMANVKLIPPTVNPHKLISSAQAVVVINSTTGFEAIMHDKPVITFGRPFYSGNSSVFVVENLFETSKVIREALSFKPDHEENITFLTKIYYASYEGRYLGVTESDTDNVSLFCDAILDVIQRGS